MPNQPPRPDPYQHWLDDAANMGLMLFRMRNDSKREGIVQQRTPPGTPPVVMSPKSDRGRGPGTPPPRGSSVPTQPPYAQHQPHTNPLQVPPLAYQHRDTTPRTNQALLTPTVATASSSGGTQEHHHPRSSPASFNPEESYHPPNRHHHLHPSLD